MQGSRADFLEMREREAQELPVIEREEERKPKKLSKLELRVMAYEDKVRANNIRKFGLHHWSNQPRKRTDLSSLETRPLHNHAKPLTDVQKLYHIPTQKHDEKEPPTTDKIQESFRKFKKSRGI